MLRFRAHGRSAAALTMIVAVCVMAFGAAAQCPDEWNITNPIPGTSTVHASCLWNDGDGEALYLGGDLTAAGTYLLDNLAQWDGQELSPVGGGVNGPVNALVVYQGDLIVAGDFTMAGSQAAAGIARWDGTEWHALGSGHNGIAHALTIYQGHLIVGGEFTAAGGESARRIAEWDGSQWSSLTEGTTGPVYALHVYQDQLYAGGIFGTAGQVSASNVAAWNGSAWVALGSGTDAIVQAFATYNEELIVAGNFLQAGPFSVKRIVRWNGSEWLEIGSGPNYKVLSLEVYQDKLVVGGRFNNAGGVNTRGLAWWSDLGWEEFTPDLRGAPDHAANTLLAYGDDLYIGGLFAKAGMVQMFNIGRFDGTSWHPLTLGVNNEPFGMGLFQGDLIVTGDFSHAGGQRVNGVARLVDGSWQPLDSGFRSPSGRCALVYRDDLYVGGDFVIDSEEGFIRRIARWDGSSWSSVGGGLDGISNDPVNTLVEYNGKLIAGGEFQAADGKQVNNIAAWNGSTWEPLGDGVDGDVNALVVWNGDLIVGGNFTSASGVPDTWKIARWDGSEWHPLARGIDGTVLALATYDGDLFVGGSFNTALNPDNEYLTVRHIARWDGIRWHQLIVNEHVGTNGGVSSLAEHDGRLFVGGGFDQVGGEFHDGLVTWNGAEWNGFEEVSGACIELLIMGTRIYASNLSVQLDGRISTQLSALETGCDEERAELADFAVVVGQLIAGGKDELNSSDDTYLQTRSQLGFSAFEPNVMELETGFASVLETPSLLRIVIESRINHPVGTAQLRIRNWDTGALQSVGQYTITPVETSVEFADLPADGLVRDTDGRIELYTRHVVIATFSAIGFDSFFDEVAVFTQ